MSPQALKSLRLEKLRRRAATEATRSYGPRGAAAELQNLTNPEIVISGPAGTGKSRACFEKIRLLAEEHAGARFLIVRKTRTSLTETGLVTWEKDVLGALHPLVLDGPRRQFRQSYVFPNKSEVVVGGMDKAGRILSGEFDVIFVQQAEELEESDWETLITRLRHGVVPYQQIIGDCNPDAPTHWLKQRCDAGTATMLESRHEDNPTLWDGGDWTEGGRAYISKLDRLSGARKERLRFGRWRQAEGAIYEQFDAAVHVVDRFNIPEDWRRIRVVDFGFTNPFVCQWWALDGDGRMYRYREIYMTNRTVKQHAEKINELSKGERIEATICDHDAEDRATLHENGIITIAAKKDVSLGIDRTSERIGMRPGVENDEPRIFFLRDSLVETDAQLAEAKRPTCTEQEFDGYVWANHKTKEVPVKKDDHGMDTTRYGVMYVDGGPGVVVSQELYEFFHD